MHPGGVISTALLRGLTQASAVQSYNIRAMHAQHSTAWQSAEGKHRADPMQNAEDVSLRTQKQSRAHQTRVAHRSIQNLVGIHAGRSLTVLMKRSLMSRRCLSVKLWTRDVMRLRAGSCMLRLSAGRCAGPFTLGPFRSFLTPTADSMFMLANWTALKKLYARISSSFTSVTHVHLYLTIV